MGAKGSKQPVPSRFKPGDFFFGESAHLGQPSKATAVHLIQPPTQPQQPGREAEGQQLLAVGCEDGSVMIYGQEGVQTRLYEVPVRGGGGGPGPVIYLHALPRSLLLSVHASAIKLWSLEAMSELSTLAIAEVPRATKASSPYTITCASMSNEYDSRYCWLGTEQGECLLFDTVKKRMSAYRVPLLVEVQQHCASSGSGTAVPTAITALAQLPSDSSQLLIGYQCDLVVTYHLSTSKLHRAYKRSACGGVSALCWETGTTDAARLANHFVVGHQNGLIAVWQRKYHHSPIAVFFLSPTPGPRFPISTVRWSSRTFGFFASGGHLQTTEATTEPIDSSAVVFVSGVKFEHRKMCTTAVKKEGDLSAPAGVKDFVQILMARPQSANTPAPAKSQPTPAFLCLEQSGQVRLHFPTVQPPVPSLPISHMHEQTYDSVSMLAATPEEAPALRSLLTSMRSMHPAFRPWLALIRTSLAEQHLWPLNGGCTSAGMAALEAEEDLLFRRLNLDGSVAAAPTPVINTPAPALLITTHSAGSEVAVRLHDATSPFQLDLLAVLSLTRVLPAGATVTTTMFCLARKELIIGTFTGEVLIYRLPLAKPQTPAPSPTPTSPTPSVPVTEAAAPTYASSTSPAPATETAASPPPSVQSPPPAATSPAPAPAPLSPPSAVAAVAAAVVAVAAPVAADVPPAPAAEPVPTSPEWTLELVHRIAFSTRPVRLLLYSSDADKYVAVDVQDQFAFVRPDSGVSVKQAIPNATITAAHFSTEALIKPKSGMPPSSCFLYVCGSDGTVHMFAGDLEAKLAVIPSISADETRLEVIQFMKTVSIQAPSSEVGQPDATQRYIICCTNQSIKLLTGGTKGVESLLSLRTAEPIRLAFLVCSPHLIEQRDPPAAAAGEASPSAAASAPARELCLAIVDTTSQLTAYSVQLKVLFSAKLRMDAGRVSSATFSMSDDGRSAFLPTSSFLTQAQLFPGKCYGNTQPPARLVRPIERSIDDIEAATACTPVPAPAASSSWFSSLLPTAASHASLWDVAMYEPLEEVDSDPAPSSENEEEESPSTEERPTSTPPRPERAVSSTSISSTSSTKAAAPAPASSASSSAQSAVASAKDKMAQNQAMAANNLARAEEIQDKAQLMSDHAGDFLAAARKLKQQQKDSWW